MIKTLEENNFPSVPYSSLLIVYDADNSDLECHSDENKIKVYLIDFGFYQMKNNCEKGLMNSLRSFTKFIELISE